MKDPDFRPSRNESLRLAEVDASYAADGTVEIIDNSLEKWEPTEQQESFLEHLLDNEECKLSMYLAVHAADGTMRLLNEWCRTQPQFLALFKDRVQERFEIAEIGADLTVVGAAAGELKPTRDEKWGVEQIGKIKDFLHKKEIRYIQINQQFNMGSSIDQDDEELQRVIDAGAETIQRAITQG